MSDDLPIRDDRGEQAFRRFGCRVRCEPQWLRAPRLRVQEKRGAGRRPAGNGLVISYWAMQVSTLSAVHSSRPVNSGSSTSLPLIRSIITDGAR
jgi:hypothetical protein